MLRRLAVGLVIGTSMAVTASGLSAPGQQAGASPVDGPSKHGTPPRNTSPPAVSGTALAGQTLTTTSGTWSGSAPISYSDRWLRCDTNGNNCVLIPGATATRYLLGVADVGSSIRSQVTATNGAGAAKAQSARTQAVQAQASPPINTAPPVVSGEPRQGQTLSSSTGTWSNSPTSYAYQWLQCDTYGNNCAAIDGATSSSYLVAAPDIASTLRSQVTGSNSSGSATAQSAATAAITPAPSSDTSPPSEPGAASVSHISQTAATLSWQPSTDNVTVAGYELWLNDLQDGTTTSLSHTFTGLSCGASYTLAVAAYDSAGNVSQTSFSSVTTSACAGYSVSSTITTGQPLAASVQWIASPSDVSATARVTFSIDGNLSWTATASPYRFGGATGYLDTTTLAKGTHALSITAYPTSGTPVTQSSTIIVSNQPAMTPNLTLPAPGIAAGGSLQTWTLTDLNRQFADYQNLHARWIRHDFDWSIIEPQQGTYNWAGYDQLVRAAANHNLNVIATIDYTPPWANGGHSDHRYQPNSADQFGQFAGQVAARYAPQHVHTYEIWNEPNIGYWQPSPDPNYYTHVLCAAYGYIHAADPQATVITGGTSPAADSASTYSPQTWLTDLYSNGGKPCFDGVSHHPYIDSSTTPNDLGNAWDLMYDAYPPSNLRGIMSANGDSTKRIWATEVGCNRVTLGNTECSNRIQEALNDWQSYTWAGALTYFIYWDPNVYGLVDGDSIPRPEFYAYQTAASAIP